MKLQKKRDAEIAQRQGSTKKTIIFGIWLIISILLGVGLVYYLDSSGAYTLRTLRTNLQLPRTFPDLAVGAIAVFVIVVLSQIALSFGFLIANPEGRRKAGKGDLRTRYNDYNDYKN